MLIRVLGLKKLHIMLKGIAPELLLKDAPS